jgi:hypothetical protein
MTPDDISTNVVFFGASVTEQGGESGYTTIVKRLLDKCDKKYNMIKEGYGSMHLSDAGICKIDTIIKHYPKICFLDWFVTGFICIDKKKLYMYLDAIVRKLLLINCHVVFLLFDRSDMTDNRLLMFQLVIEYAKMYNLKYIALYNNNKELLRDTVHTNANGAEFYGLKIFESISINNIESIVYDKIPEENKYSNLKNVQINKKILINMIINGNFELIGIFQSIGLNSGIVEISRDDKPMYIVNFWDQWCHFNRRSIKGSIPLSKTVRMTITNTHFDTSSCNTDIEFNNLEKYMFVYELIYFGEIESILIDDENVIPNYV